MTEHLQQRHPREALAAYALAALDTDEGLEVETHLASCARCREEYEEVRSMTDLLGELPPEALLDGPPEDGDLLLQRTLEAIGSERRSQIVRRRWMAGAAAAAAAFALFGAGALAGRQSAQQVALPAPTSTSTSTTIAGTFTLAATDPATGTQLSAQVIPAAGWVRINAQVKGIAAGQRCRIVVVAKDGHQEIAGSWLVPAAGLTSWGTISGSAIVAPDQVAAIVIENEAGTRFVTAARA